MSITLTPRANQEIKTILQERQLPNETALRLSILGGGCHGMQYNLGLDTNVDVLIDAKYDCNGIFVVAEKKFDLYLDGTIVDFIDTEIARGFSVENPNFPQGGGCPGCGG